MNPDFDSEITDYSASVGNETNNTSIIATPTDINAIVKIDGVTGNSKEIALVEGENEIEIEVTAEDGISTKTYTINITRTTSTGLTTVTQMEIRDAIAPINGGAPVLEIIETDEYTGSVVWDGEPTSFSPNTGYTATITLTAKEGYTFDGVAENAFKLLCAMSATNDADFGVITATFKSPPEGYITDGNGVMAYRYTRDTFDDEPYPETFEIQGFFYNDWKQTTFSNNGYTTQYRIGAGTAIVVNATGELVALGDTGLTMDIGLDFVSEGKALQIRYTIKNTSGTLVEGLSFGSHADIQIGGDDSATITTFDDSQPVDQNRGFKMVSRDDTNLAGEYAQFNFFGKRSVGVTDVDSFWFGRYGNRRDNLFNQIEEHDLEGTDSGMAYSWQNRTIGAGGTQVYTVVIGIGGAESGEVLGYSVSYDDNVPGETITVPETQQKVENMSLTLSAQKPVRSGYVFNSWNTQADGSGTPYAPGATYTANDSLVLYAQWEVVISTEPPSSGSSSSGSSSSTYYYITPKASDGGRISPSSKVELAKNKSKTFTITANEGYIIEDVLVDGKSVGKVSDYTFDSIKSNHTIEAKFTKGESVTVPEKVPEASAQFIDLDLSGWYMGSINYILERKLFNGTSATTFEPNSRMTRAMLVTVLHRLEGNPLPIGGHPYKDALNVAWYQNPVAWGTENGVVKGYGNEMFKPNNPLTREEMASIFYRFATYKGYDISAAADLSKYNDTEDIYSWALPAIKWAVGEEIMEGIDETTLQPKGYATRAQVATILMKFIETVK